MLASPLPDTSAALVVDRDRLFGEVVTPLLEDLEFQVWVTTIAEAAHELISRITRSLRWWTSHCTPTTASP